MSVLPPIEEKSVYVERMFSRIAPDYDRMNKIMTFGMDRAWRDVASSAVAPPAKGRALDVGCGTGELLAALAEWTPDGFAVGVDYTIPMMSAGHPNLRPVAERAAFVGGDALCLPFADNTFDAITTGFVMRNVVNIAAAFAEMWRVARPGALLACLEVARPKNPLLRLGHSIYFHRLVPLIARALGADATAYTYLPESARAFPAPEALAQIMRHVGWRDVRYRTLGFGAVAVHTGIKRAIT